MIRVAHSIVIRRPVAEVFAVVADVETWPRWNATAREAHKTSPGPMGVGTRFRLAGHLFGRAVQMDHEVTAYEPPRMFAATTLSGPFRATGTYTFEPLDGDTRLNLVMEGEPGGVMKLAAAALGPAIKRQVETQQAHLKELLEGGRLG